MLDPLAFGNSYVMIYAMKRPERRELGNFSANMALVSSSSCCCVAGAGQ
jgi:hypothetical protein